MMDLENNLQETQTVAIMGKDYKITYLHPLLDEPFKFQSKTLLILTYYGAAMNPTLKAGDRLIFKKCRSIPADSEVYMIQYGEEDNIITGRLCPSVRENRVHLFFDNPIGFSGQDLKKEYIIAVWELLSSTRLHKMFKL